MKILAVDDDPIILDLLTEVLASLGYHDLTVASCAADALVRLDEAPRPFDCVLLDIQMPGMDGISLCEVLRALPGYTRTPILMLTALSDKVHVDRAFNVGATDYVTKPFDITELGARLRTAELLVPRRDAGETARLSVQETFRIEDVDGVIDYVPMENYLLRLSRLSLLGSSVFALSVRDIERLHASTSDLEFRCTMIDVAEALSDAMKPRQFLIAYAGAGIFACVTETRPPLDLAALEDEVRLYLEDMELCYNDGRPLYFQIGVGEAVRLSLKSGRGVLDALDRACRSAAEDTRRSRGQGTIANSSSLLQRAVS